MGDSSFGKEFTVTVFGESHGPGVAAVIDGCPAGLSLTLEDIQRELDRRIPADPTLVSARREKDEVEILSGYWQRELRLGGGKHRTGKYKIGQPRSLTTPTVPLLPETCV